MHDFNRSASSGSGSPARPIRVPRSRVRCAGRLGRFGALAALACGLLAGACGLVEADEPACVVEGESYLAGERFAAGCNTCTCQPDGSTSCTRLDCSDGCVVDGVRREVGERFDAPDGCNTCTCEEGGLASCTQRGCLPSDGCVVDGVRREVGERFDAPDGCNTCTCSEGGSVACTERACLPGDGCVVDGARVACPEPICGGLAGLACDAGFFCDFAAEARCGAADQTGVCQPQPEACDAEYDPVCGCDDRTYGNACSAHGAGVSVAASGECAGAECSDDFDCPQPDCACLDEDGDGACDNTCPVSECVDGRCVVSVSEPSLGLGEACGGFRLPGSPECAAGLFCQHQPGADCGAADGPGECVEVPESCLEVYFPVCGCDGNTYSSACHAALVQVGIDRLGECE